MANLEAPVELAAGVAYLTTGISNVYYVGDKDNWVLVDAGVVGYTRQILAAAAARFGADAVPRAILLTHGHYDHVGCARDLHAHWGVPVLAHALELPYLTGKSDYPQKDPTVGGAMGFLSRFFPSRTVDLRGPLIEVPEGPVPGLPGWTTIHTPGHSPGHVCFWREADGFLIGGDVVATADLDSWIGITVQRAKVSRPPSPFTYDWNLARSSVRQIAELCPRTLACGHGPPMGADAAVQLTRFADDFRAPAHGRYVETPAKADRDGVVYEPPAPPDRLPKIAAGIVAGSLILAGAIYRKRSGRSNPGGSARSKPDSSA